MKFIQLLIMIALLVPNAALAKKSKKSSKKSTPTLVQSVTGESSETISLVTLTLNKALKNKKDVKLSEHGRYLQVDLSGVSAAQPGSFFEANSPFLKKMALFETSSNDTALRIFTDEDTSIVSEVAEIDVLENRIILSLDHRILKSRLEQTIDAATAGSFTDQLEKMSEPENKVGPDLPEVKEAAAPTLAADKPVSGKTEAINASLTELGVGKTSLDLSQNLRKVAFFLGGLFVLLIAALTFKRIKKNTLLAQKATEDTLKSLGTLSLNPKQQLNLVEVGGEKILLSVSNETVSLISHIGQAAKEEGPLLGPAKSEAVNRKLLGGAAPKASEPAGGFPETLKALRKKAQEIEKRQSVSRAPSTRFDEAVTTGETFKPKRTPKKASTLSNAAAPKAKASSPAPKKNTGKKINVAVSDEGISNLSKKAPAENQDEAIKDVTSLIRQKLKDLPKF